MNLLDIDYFTIANHENCENQSVQRIMFYMSQKIFVFKRKSVVKEHVFKFCFSHQYLFWICHIVAIHVVMTWNYHMRRLRINVRDQRVYLMKIDAPCTNTSALTKKKSIVNLTRYRNSRQYQSLRNPYCIDMRCHLLYDDVQKNLRTIHVVGSIFVFNLYHTILVRIKKTSKRVCKKNYELNQFFFVWSKFVTDNNEKNELIQ